MDDARNNPALSDEGERAAGTSPATPRAQVPTLGEIGKLYDRYQQFQTHENSLAFWLAIQQLHVAADTGQKDAARLDGVERYALAVFNNRDPDLEPTPGFGQWWVKLSEDRYSCEETLRAAIDGALRDGLRASSEGARAQ